MSAPIATGPDDCRGKARRLRIVSAIGIALAACAVQAQAPEPAEAGRKLFQDPQKGNCAACHRLASENAKRAATVGPVLEGVREKFPDHAMLVQAIAEADSLRPDTIMPPYRRNRILTEIEIEAIARYLETL